jgi:hypothetical protein
MNMPASTCAHDQLTASSSAVTSSSRDHPEPRFGERFEAQVAAGDRPLVVVRCSARTHAGKADEASPVGEMRLRQWSDPVLTNTKYWNGGWLSL